MAAIPATVKLEPVANAVPPVAVLNHEYVIPVSVGTTVKVTLLSLHTARESGTTCAVELVQPLIMADKLLWQLLAPLALTTILVVVRVPKLFTVCVKPGPLGAVNAPALTDTS